MQLYITSIAATPIPHFKHEINMKEQYMVIFALDNDCTSYMFECPFRPFILMQFETEPNMSDPNVVNTQSSILEDINNHLCYNKENFDMEQDFQVQIFGYTASKKVSLWKLYYTRLTNRQRLVDHFHKYGFTSGEEGSETLGKVKILHQNTFKPNQEHIQENYEKGILKERKFGFSHEEHFKQITGLHAHTWCQVNLDYINPITNVCAEPYPYVQGISRFIDICFKNVDPFHCFKELESCVDIPPISILYLRLVGYSDDATNTNILMPDFKKPKDRIQMIGLLNQHLKQPIKTKCCKKSKQECKCDFNANLELDTHIHILENDIEDPIENEKYLLLEFKRYIEIYNPQILIQSTCYQNDLEYLIHRAEYIFGKDYSDLGLCLLTNLLPRLTYSNQIDSFTLQSIKKLNKIEHVGRERLDIVGVLKKFYLEVPLHDFSLIDAYKHETLIHEKDKRNVHLDILQLHHRASLNDIEKRIRQELKVMYYICVDNSFIEGQMLLARYSDATVQTVCERGVELQTRNYMMKRFVKKKLYMDHEELEKPFYTEKRLRCNSSFPHPPDIENPTEDEIIGRKSVKIRRKIDMSVFGLKDEQAWDDPVQHMTKKSKKGYSGGLVVKAEPGFRTNPRYAAIICDFQSLYPSDIIGFLICYMTVIMEHNKHLIKDPKAKIRWTPLDDETCYASITHYDDIPVETIIPEITEEIMERRNTLKRFMKAEKDPIIKQTYNCRQLTAKIQANALYGFIGSTSSGMSMMCVAACVCLIAQYMNRLCIWYAKSIGGRIIGGDTDSTFSLWNVTDTCPLNPDGSDPWTKEQIYAAIMKKGCDFAKKCSSFFPPPNKYVAEALKNPILTTDALKLHCSLAFEEPSCGWENLDWSTAEPKVCLKGPAFKKRDRCELVQQLGYEFIEKLLKQRPEEEILKLIHDRIQIINNEPLDTLEKLRPFIITCQLNEEYKNEEESKAKYLAAEILKESGIMIKPGRRMEFVIARFDDGRKRYKHCMTPTTFINEHHQLDTTHVLLTQLYPTLGQLTEMHLPLFARKIKQLLEDRALYLDLEARGELLSGNLFDQKKLQFSQQFSQQIQQLELDENENEFHSAIVEEVEEESNNNNNQNIPLTIKREKQEEDKKESCIREGNTIVKPTSFPTSIATSIDTLPTRSSLYDDIRTTTTTTREISHPINPTPTKRPRISLASLGLVSNE